jgi:hypothetical protein
MNPCKPGGVALCSLRGVFFLHLHRLGSQHPESAPNEARV